MSVPVYTGTASSTRIGTATSPSRPYPRSLPRVNVVSYAIKGIGKRRVRQKVPIGCVQIVLFQSLADNGPVQENQEDIVSGQYLIPFN
ncbi:hypothetical protein VTK26DRAFT_9272 [Humicola hyalothermophila]